MAAKSDGMLKMKKSDVAFTPLQNSDHSGSVQGLTSGSQPGSGAGDGGCSDGGSRCCCSGRAPAGVGGGGGSPPSLCLRLGREQRRYTVWDCLWILAAVTVYFADVGSDIWLSVDYYLRGQRWWFGLTLFFVVLGSLSVQVFSFRWFVHDFSTENSSQCSPADAKAASGSAASGEVDVRPSTPQRQASTASNKPTNPASQPNKSASCSFCIWIMQSLIHILQLGQIWR